MYSLHVRVEVIMSAVFCCLPPLLTSLYCRDELVKTRTWSNAQLSQLEQQLTDVGIDIENSIKTIADDVQLKASAVPSIICVPLQTINFLWVLGSVAAVVDMDK